MTMTRYFKTVTRSIGMVVAAGASMAHGDILYDALYADVSVPGPYSGESTFVGSTIDGFNAFGVSYDAQAADDFSLAQAVNISSVTFDIAPFLNLGPNTMPTSMRVEFFTDNGGAPAAESSFSSIISSGDYASVIQFENNGLWGDDGSAPGFRIAMDLSGEGIELSAGAWWVAVQGISGDNIFNILTSLSDQHQTGSWAQVRDAGLAHGNGYAGVFGSTDWIAAPGDVGDLAIRIEGSAVPAPGGAALFGLTGLLATGRRRR